jgi:tripartite-type tricarboxylate transporter receptor subunit TctC
MPAGLPARCLASLLILIAFAPAPSRADDYPSRVVKIVVPFAAGGTLDATARRLAELLRIKWNQAVIVENRPGAGTLIATRYVAQSAPDGYTILMTDFALATNDLLHSNLGYDSDKGLAPVTTVVTYPLGIAVTSSMGPVTLKEFVELSKTKPLNYGSFGPGTAPHLVMELFKKQSGARIEHIPYGGIAPVMMALNANDVQATVMGVGAALPSLENGTLRLLALDEKAPLAPDVPTFKEAGYPNMRAPAWWAIVAPGGTPAAIVTRLNRDIAAALQQPELKDFLVKNAYVPIGDSPESLAARVKDTRELWAPIVAASGVTVN